MSKDPDDWPDRCGIPKLEEALKKAAWVKACLSDDGRQGNAKRALTEAEAYLRQAIALLREDL